VAKVFVVDDSVSVRKAVERLLAPRGMTVTSCASGNEALARLPGEAPDLVICDLVLPDLDGYEVCRWLRQVPALAATPVLFISGIVDADVASRVAALGVEGVLKKPFSGEDLAATVERILAASRLAAPAPDSSASPAAATVPPAGADASTAESAAAGPASPGSPRIRALLSEVTTLAGFRCVLILSPGSPESPASPGSSGLPGPRMLALAGDLPPAAGDSADLTPAALVGWLAAAASVAGQLDLGEPGSAVLEAAAGTLLARRVDARATLVLLLASSAALGKARLYLAKLQRAILESWDAAPAGTSAGAGA
jgi:CheY-like chemotaxis protein/predicted regulator of Ras-like GTPase activity (Roadblock/LC7/MglB family)